MIKTVLYFIFALTTSPVLAYDKIAAAKAAGAYYGSAVMIDELFSKFGCPNNEFPNYRNGARQYVYSDIIRSVNERDRAEFILGMTRLKEPQVETAMKNAAYEIYAMNSKKDKASACMKTELMLMGAHAKTRVDFLEALR